MESYIVLNILITGCLWDSVYLVCMIRVVNPLLVVGDMNVTFVLGIQ